MCIYKIYINKGASKLNAYRRKTHRLNDNSKTK